MLLLGLLAGARLCVQRPLTWETPHAVWGDGRLPDADPIAEGFLRASSLRLDPTKPLCWHLDGEHVPRQASRMWVVGAAAAQRQR
jgi:hypothetical protein